MKQIITPIILLLISFNTISAQVKKPQAKVYYSTTQKILKGFLADATEEIVHHKVTIKVLLNQYEFIYPNHERPDVLVKMTKEEWMEGVKEQDYVVSHPDIKEIYFMKDKNIIWLDFIDGQTIIYTLSVAKAPVKK